MTTPERWKEIDRVFAAALEHEPAGREAFLDEACAGDAELRKEVESLLAHDRPETFVSGPAVEEATQLFAMDAGVLAIKRIGRYQIMRALGAGGMGQVFLGRDEQLNRLVAVKLLSNYRAAEDERMSRFRQEALSASALNHPNILTIYEIGKFGSTNFIATEFVDGLTLSERIEQGRISTDETLNIAQQIASALTAAHTAGIIHRDIKSANVMVRADGLVKVLDFGIAKYQESRNTTDNQNVFVETLPGAVMGTAAYMSPEQARGLPVDVRSDIWSLGVVVYEMIAGRRPFLGDTTMDVMSAVLERQPAPLSAPDSAVPGPLERIVFKALHKDRDARYSSANEMLAELKDLSKKLEFAADSGRNSMENKPATPAGDSSLVIKENRTVRGVSAGTLSPEVKTTAPVKAPVRNYKWLFIPGLILVLGALVALWLGYPFRRNLSSIKQIESMAVMPIVNASGNAEIEYLSDGMTDMLITSLSQVPNLSVKAHSSVFRYKNKDVQPQQVGKDLNVQAVLNGRVVQRGNDLALHIELVDVRTETTLWVADYSRSVSNLAAVQSEIASDVSQKLRTRLSGPEQQKVTKDYTANSEARDLYLRGRFHNLKLTPTEVQQGIVYFQQAIQHDPNYALAYVGLSEAYRGLTLSGELKPTEYMPRAKEAAQKALDLDDTLAEAHTAVGVVNFWYDWNWSAAESQFKRALELKANSADTHLSYAHMLSNTGRHQEALSEIKRARELDPYNPLLNALEGQFLIHAGKLDEALSRLRATFELAPGFWFPHVFASSAYMEKGMFAEAVIEAKKAGELSSAQTASIVFEGVALARMGRKDETRILLEKLLKLSKETSVPASHIAVLYHALGEDDETFKWLERGIEQRDPKMTFLKVQPRWNNLRGDPRFQDIMRRVGFS